MAVCRIPSLAHKAHLAGAAGEQGRWGKLALDKIARQLEEQEQLFTVSLAPGVEEQQMVGVIREEQEDRAAGDRAGRMTPMVLLVQQILVVEVAAHMIWGLEREVVVS